MNKPLPYLTERQYHGRKQTRPIRPTNRVLMQELLPSIHIDLPDNSSSGPLDTAADLIDPTQVFLKPYPQYWLEIGFGGGEHMIQQAKHNPDVGYMGAEPFINGVAHALKGIKAENLSNVRLFTDDVRMLLRRLPDACLDKIFILFPDPWPKKRHFKRRIIQASFLPMLHRVLRQSGELVIATDHADYQAWILDIFDKQSLFKGIPDERTSLYLRPETWFITRYEQKALTEGRASLYLRYLKTEQRIRIKNEKH